MNGMGWGVSVAQVVISSASNGDGGGGAVVEEKSMNLPEAPIPAKEKALLITRLWEDSTIADAGLRNRFCISVGQDGSRGSACCPF